MKTKAIVFADVGRVEFVEVDIPQPNPDEVLVRSSLSGVSVGTDGWYVTGKYSAVRDRYPVIYGYARVGVVGEVGSEVETFEVGQRVFVGNPKTRLVPSKFGNSCGNYTGWGCHKSEDVVPIPDSVSDEEATMVGLASVPVVGRDLTGVLPDDLVVVLGQGMIGQSAAQLCRAQGAKVITADPLQQRVELSESYSSDIAVNIRLEDLASVVFNESSSGADVVFECAGRSDTMDLILDIVRGGCNDSEKSGKVCMQGYFPNPITIDFHAAHMRRLTMTFPCGFDVAGSKEIMKLLDERQINLSPLITHEWDLEQAPQAFQYMIDQPGDVLGMFIRWPNN